MAQEIPAVDLTDFDSSDMGRREECAETINRGLHHIGFIAVKTPELAAQRDQAYAAFAEVFNLPEDELIEKYSRPDIAYLRGYTPLRAETAAACRTSGSAGNAQPDERSGWLIGPESFSDSTLKQRFPVFHADNVWPKDYPRFREEATRYYELMNDVGKHVLRALETSLGYEDGFFEEVTRDGYTSLRPLHYPPVAPENAANTVWGCKHTDRNLLSVLPPSTGKGLYVKTRAGEWIPGQAPEGYSIVQVGDTLKYMTGGHFRSAVHKIEVPEAGTELARYSAPLFIYARHDVNIQPDPNVWQADPRRYPPRTAGEYFAERLQVVKLASPNIDENV